MTFSMEEIVTDIKGTDKASHSNSAIILVDNAKFIKYFSLSSDNTLPEL